jgi:regulator of protease activity HflC (stomatin/prohibitin superfamily)
MSTNSSFSRGFSRIPAKYLIVGGVALIVLLIINSIVQRSVLVIHPGERGLITYLGKLQNDSLDEGIHFVPPFITTLKTVDVRIQKTDITSVARTKDLQRIDTQITLNWQMEPSKLGEIYQQIGSAEDIVNKIINPAFDETVKALIPARTLEKNLAEREQLKEEVFAKIKTRLAHYGIVVVDVAIVNLTSSEQFTRATEERQTAEQKAITAKLIAEQAIQEAELKAQKAKIDAEAVVNAARGQAQAQRLLQQTLTPELLQREAIEKWNGQFPTVLGDSSALPLINIAPPQTTPPQTATP